MQASSNWYAMEFESRRPTYSRFVAFCGHCAQGNEGLSLPTRVSRVGMSLENRLAKRTMWCHIRFVGPKT